jgi:anti-anti-sigma factor
VVEIEEPVPRTLLLCVRGKLDEAVGLDLTRPLHTRSGTPEVTRVLVDLIAVTALTEAGVRALHLLYRDCRVKGLRLVLIGSANPAVHRVLYLSGLLPLVDVRPTVEAALRPHAFLHRPTR